MNCFHCQYHLELYNMKKRLRVSRRSICCSLVDKRRATRDSDDLKDESTALARFPFGIAVSSAKRDTVVTSNKKDSSCGSVIFSKLLSSRYPNSKHCGPERRGSFVLLSMRHFQCRFDNTWESSCPIHNRR
jgi:hypothetical protein